MSFRSTRRCHWYKDDGTPRTQSRTGLQGCHWPKCSFAHPGTPQWETASSSRPPESYEKAEYSRSVKREDGRERERQDRERLDREREWEREREEREKERIRDREREVERERERDSDRDRDRERARSPRVPTGPSASTSATRDPRLARSSASSSSVAGPSSSGSTSYPPNNPSTPSRSGVSTLTRHDTMSMATATTTSVTHSPQLDRSNTAPSGSYTSASRARGYSTASVERSRYGSRDRDRSPMSSTSESRPRVESSSSYARVRQDTSTSTVIPQSPALPTATVKAISAMPPPPVLKLGKAASPAPVSTTPATQSASKSSTTGTTAAGSAQVPSRNDKVRIWVDRIKQLSDAVQTRSQHIALERELTSLRSLLASRQYANLSDTAREKLEKQVKETEDRFSAKKAELNQLVYKLVDSEFWDAAMSWPGLGDAASDPKGKGKEREKDFRWEGSDANETAAETRFRELRTVVWQVRDGVDELYKIVGELRGSSSVDDDGGRPSKKRRLSDSLVTDDSMTLISTSSSSETPKRPTAAHALSFSDISGTKILPMPPVELETITDKLTALDGRVADLENNMVQFDHEMLSELELRMEERLQDLSLNARGDEGEDDSDMMAVDGEPSGGLDTGQGAVGNQRRSTLADKLKAVEAELERAGDDISALAVEMAEIITNAKSAQEEIDQLKSENAEMRERIASLERQHAASSETLEAFKVEMEALNTALQAFIARPRTPTPEPPPPAVPPPPPVPDMQTIVDTIGPLVLQSVRDDITPMLEQLKEGVQALLQRQNTQIAQSVMSKLQLTLKTVEVIYAWMNRTVAGQTPQPTPASAMAAPARIGQTNGAGSVHGASTPIAGGSTSRGSTPVTNGTAVLNTMIPAKPLPP